MYVLVLALRRLFALALVCVLSTGLLPIPQAVAQAQSSVPNDPYWDDQWHLRHMELDHVWPMAPAHDLEKDPILCFVTTALPSIHEDLDADRHLGTIRLTPTPSGFGRATITTGAAVAVRDNNLGIAGIVDAPYLVIETFEDTWNGDPDVAAQGIDRCVTEGAEIIVIDGAWNQDHDVVRDAVEAAAASDALLFAHDDGVYPAAYEAVIGVFCTDSSDVPCTSYRGDFAAPSAPVPALCTSASDGYCDDLHAEIAHAHAAAVAALVWKHHPYLTAEEVRAALFDGARDMERLSRVGVFDHLVLDALGAVLAPVPDTPLDQVLHVQSFDTGNTPSGWTFEGLWHVSDLCATPPSPPAYLGFHRATGCDYDLTPGIEFSEDRVNGGASFTVDLRGLTQASLEYDAIRDLHDHEYDEVRVEVRREGIWHTLELRDGEDPDLPNWTRHVHDLDPYVGQEVVVRFYFDSWDGLRNDGTGWLIDNVTVRGTEHVAPKAKAGPDIVVRDSDGDGTESFVVDGTASHDLFDNGTVVSYDWYVDGTHLSNVSVATLAAGLGTHDVTLVVTDDDGISGSDSLELQVLPTLPPIADAGPHQRLPDADGDGHRTVTLDAGRSTDPDGTIVAYTWRHASNGTIIANTSTTTVVLPVGSHQVELEVTDNAGASDTDVGFITVRANQPPTAGAWQTAVTAKDTDASGDQTVSLYGGRSTDDGLELEYEWYSGGTLRATGIRTMLTFPVGTTNVTLLVRDEAGLEDTEDVTVTVVPNQPPIVGMWWTPNSHDIDGDGEQQAGFGLSFASDDGTIVSRTWSIDGVDRPEYDGASHIWPLLSVGTHDIRVTITDNGGATATDNTTAVVHPNAPPTANFTATCAGRLCTFEAGSSTDDGWDPQYLWNFGDGNTTTSDAWAPTTTHRYATTGTFDACLTYIDEAGANDTTCQQVHTNGVVSHDFDERIPPGATFNAPWRLTNETVCGSAHTGDTYLAYRTDSGCDLVNQTDAKFRLPIDLTGIQDPVLRYEQRGQGGGEAPSVWIERRTDWGHTLSPVYTAEGLDDTTWAPVEVSLADYADQADLALVWRFQLMLGTFSEGSGEGYEGEPPALWMIDSVQVGESDEIARPNLEPTAVIDGPVDLYDTDGDGAAMVTLHGDRSADPDGTITNHTWYVDGAAAATGPNASLWLAVGQHNVTLIVADDDGATSDATTMVEVHPNRAPTAVAGPSITVADADGDGHEPVVLDGSGSSDPDGTTLGYEWLSDGVLIADTAVVDLSFPVGDHDVVLRVTDAGGANASDLLTVVVRPNTPPVAVAAAPASVSDTDASGDESVLLDGTGSSDAEGDIDHTWWLQGTIVASGPTPALTLPVGQHQVTLVVTDAAGTTDSTTSDVEVVANAAPVANGPADLTVNDDDRVGSVPVLLDGSTSFDPDGTLVEHIWSVDGNVIGSDAAVEHVFPHGTHAVTLTVTDDGGATSLHALNVTVTANRVPIAVLDVACVDLTCSFDATGSSDADGDVLSYAWDLGDGTTSSDAAFQHVYAEGGDHAVTLVLDDGHGGTVSATEQVTVEPDLPPVAHYRFACSGLHCWFDARTSTDEDGTIVERTWGFGDGAGVAGPGLVRHDYIESGTYEVTLAVQDDAGNTDVLTQTVTVPAHVPVKPLPFGPPTNPHMRDRQQDTIADQANAAWLDIERAWFDGDIGHLYVGIQVRDLPAEPGVQTPVTYRVTFDAGWASADPTLGGSVPPGHEPVRFEVLATLPMGAVAGSEPTYSLRAQARDDTTGRHTWFDVAALDGSSDTTRDIVWMPVPRDLLGLPDPGSLVASPEARAGHRIDGMWGHSTLVDDTGVGTAYRFPSV